MNKKIIAILAVVIVAVLAGAVIWSRYQKSGQSITEKAVEEKTDFYEITAKYPIDPWDKDGAIKEFVNYQVDQRKEDWKVGGDIYNTEKDVEARFPDRPKMVYTMDITYTKYDSPKFGTRSYVFIIGEYTGGANANARVQSFSFNKDGRIQIGDILNLADDHNDIELTKILFDKAMTDPERFPSADITREGTGLAYLKDDGITFDQSKCHCDGFLFSSNFQNFVIKDEGIDFFFGKYQATIGASGVVDVMLDWDALAPYLEI
ncbi:MAG: DUF3298 domain-containing protein [Parcubacteria group bacterium]